SPHQSIWYLPPAAANTKWIDEGMSAKTLYIFSFLCYPIYNQNIRRTCETCPFPEIPREEAPAAASAPTSKKRIPLASLHRASNVYALTPLQVTKARFSSKRERRGIWVEPRRVW